MYRKIFLTLTLALTLALMSTLALAQAPPMANVELPPEMAAALAKEKALTQADIDAYIKVLPKTSAVAQDPAAVAKLYQEAGLNETRLTYVASKIGLGMALAAGATPEQINLNQMPEVLRPTDAEVALVKKNIQNLQNATMEMLTNMQKAQ